MPVTRSLSSIRLRMGRAEAVDPRARLIVGGVGDASVLEQALPGVDAVMHLAGYIEVAESQADARKVLPQQRRPPRS